MFYCTSVVFLRVKADVSHAARRRGGSIPTLISNATSGGVLESSQGLLHSCPLRLVPLIATYRVLAFSNKSLMNFCEQIKEIIIISILSSLLIKMCLTISLLTCTSFCGFLASANNVCKSENECIVQIIDVKGKYIILLTTYIQGYPRKIWKRVVK